MHKRNANAHIKTQYTNCSYHEIATMLEYSSRGGSARVWDPTQVPHNSRQSRLQSRRSKAILRHSWLTTTNSYNTMSSRS